MQHECAQNVTIRRAYIQCINKQYNGCSRTGERKALGALVSHAAKLYMCPLSGDYGSRSKKAQNYSQI